MVPDPKMNTEPAPKPKKSWSNPALKAMGIPRVSLPLRNWLIFWSVLASVGGAIYYDKREQRLVREKYMQQVQHLGAEPYATARLPRKISVFIAPPPDDFLEELLRHFRKYIKPVLNAAAVDFDVYTESRQGEIRHNVAEQIRALRRGQVEQAQADAAAQAKDAYARLWRRFFTETVPGVFRRREPEPEVLTSRHELYTPTDVLGLYKVAGTVEPERDNGSDPLQCGGVICVGRGAYKEYMNGVHEGLLGPLDEPQEPPKVESLEVKELLVSELAPEKESAEVSDKEATPDDFAAADGADPKQPPVPAPFILPEQYAAAQLAPELDMSRVVVNAKNTPVIFEQPVYVFALPKLTGMANMPRKIYRYFTTRTLAEQETKKAVELVEGASRPFEYKDAYMAKEEELEWPKKWVERGKTKNSEWVRELELDERVTSRMHVYGK